VEKLNKELQCIKGYIHIESLKLLDACTKEGLHFRPPVAFTGSRFAPKGGLDVLGYSIPESIVIIIQALSIGRQRPDLFPNNEFYDPMR
jgi:hypothetical protein